MSWIDRINTDFTITTGDGKSFVPNWLNASKNIEFNIAQFLFKEIAGTLVKRGTPRGTQYAIEIYFQGEDHLDTAAAFEVSARYSNPWTIAHPLYGSILVQPIGLTFDNSGYNLTKITGGIVETISDTPDKPIVSAPDKILADKADCDASFGNTYATNVPAPKAADLQDMISNASGAYKAGLASISNTVDAQDFLNAYNSAIQAITSATHETLSTVEDLQDFLSLPMEFQDSVLNRIAMLSNMLAFLHSTLTGDLSRSAKFLYENNAGTMVSAIIGASVTGIGNAYGNRRQVLNTIKSIADAYNTYLANLDSLQTLTGGLPGSYIPSREPLTRLGGLVSYAVTSLLNIAAKSKQERSLFVEEDTNVILLADRLYGLQEDDSTIDDLIAANDIGLNELLGIRKGRKIIYYV